MNIQFSSKQTDKPNRLRIAFLTGLTALTLYISACATIGNDFPVDQVTMIKIGETTQEEIREHFGSPWRVGIENGKRIWTYGKYKYRMFGEDSTQDLVIKFDDQKKVISYTFNTTDHQQ